MPVCMSTTRGGALLCHVRRVSGRESIKVCRVTYYGVTYYVHHCGRRAGGDGREACVSVSCVTVRSACGYGGWLFCKQQRLAVGFVLLRPPPRAALRNLYTRHACVSGTGTRSRLRAQRGFYYKPVGMNITRGPLSGSTLERQGLGRTRGYSYERDCFFITCLIPAFMFSAKLPYSAFSFGGSQSP